MFSTGQITEGAVNYTNAQAVCGQAATGDDPVQAGNQAHLTLPVVQACAAPIGPKWVASVTNWLCYVIDASALTYRAGSTCQDPLLLYQAIKQIIQDETAGLVRIVGGGSVGNPPPNGTGRDGDWALSHYDGNLYGPRSAGVWPALPIYWGNNRITVARDNNTVVQAYNTFIEIQGTAAILTTIPTPIGHGNETLTIYNSTGIDQYVASAVGFIAGAPNFVSGINPILVLSGQILVLKSDNGNWIVVSDNHVAAPGGSYSLKDCEGNTLAAGTAVVKCADYTPYVLKDCTGADIATGTHIAKCSDLVDYTLNDCNGSAIAPGTQIVTCAEYSPNVNPFTITSVGALMYGVSNIAAFGQPTPPIPFGSGIPTATPPTVNDYLTFAQYSERTSGGAVAITDVMATNGSVSLYHVCVGLYPHLYGSATVYGPGPSPTDIYYDTRWIVPGFTPSGASGQPFPVLTVPAGTWKVLSIYPTIMLERIA